VAELELSVKYNTLANRIGFGIMSVLFPIWALFIPFSLGLFIDLTIQYPGALSPMITALVLSAMAAIPILGILMTALFEDNRLYITKGGVSFPLYMVPFLGFRRHRSWAELGGAGVRRTVSASSEQPDRLHLHFNKTLPVEFRITSFDKVQLEQFLLAIELWGGRSTRTPELVDFQHGLQNENKGLGKLSQVRVWEEELARRFNATSFVPLEPDRELCNGTVKVVRQLAFGGLSAIYLAQHNHVNMVVLKEAVVPANADKQTRDKAEEHFAREAKFLMKLDHPNIAKVISHFCDDGRDYMILEYIQGQDLRQYIKQHGQQSEHVVVSWALQVADIMMYLHSQEPPVLHRDLTPDNLVLDHDGSVVLIDFGAANQFVGTATGTLVGKQAYMAPEQLRGRATVASDIYSFGGTMFYWLTGKDPLPLAPSHPLKEVSSLSAEIDDLIAELTTFDSESRLVDWTIISERLRAIGAESRRNSENPTAGRLPGGVS
jgi:tRNA A-37 threonylcarbamoyl transferase component Bud32